VQEEFSTHINKNLSFLKESKLLIACSGGLDSVVLASLCKSLNLDFALAHCNFSLRGKESDGDEEFVMSLAEKYSVPVFTETFDTKKYAKDKKLSTQMAARELRYNWFEEILKDFEYDYLLTAHHADDDLETFLINLSRGSGLRGLTGINTINDKIVRPLLSFNRQTILKRAKETGLYWREDSSNQQTDYLRNNLRLNVIPSYKESVKSLLPNFQKTIANLRASQGLVEDYMALVYNLCIEEVSEGYKINLTKLKELPNTDALLYELLFPFGFTAWDDISELMEAQSGKLVVSGSHRLIKNRNTLILTEIPSEMEKNEIFISEDKKKIDFPLKLQLTPIDKMGYTDKNTIYVDNDKLTYPLKLRKWREGDIFQPFGMKGKKKLSKFFKDEKLSLVAKEKIWILASLDKIVWIVGYRPDERFKVDTATTNILKITKTS
tara:strand:+ start:8566 stop:9876 length:1311 start_codon:yes stop_codon:yes gene_type:complete